MSRSHMMRQIMAKCFSSSTIHCLGQTQTTVPDVGIYIWLDKSHPIITSVSRLNAAREHSQALECNHLYSSVLEWCLELFWPETTSTLPMHSWKWLRIQHQPGTIPSGWFGYSYPIPETGMFHCYRHWQAVSAGPRARNWTLALLGLPGESYPQLNTHHITAVTGNSQGLTKMCLRVQSWQNIGSEPFQHHSMGTMWQRQDQDHIPCGQLSNASHSCYQSCWVCFGVLVGFFFPVCVLGVFLLFLPWDCLFVSLLVLVWFCIFSFGMGLLIWVFFKCCITL